MLPATGFGNARNEAVTGSGRVVAHSDEVADMASVAIGALEGIVEAPALHDAATFSICDAISGRRVVCKCDREAVDLAVKHVGERVSVAGEIRYDPQGDATSIKVEAVQAFRAGPLPQAKDIRGLFSEHKVDIDEWARFVRED